MCGRRRRRHLVIVVVIVVDIARFAYLQQKVILENALHRFQQIRAERQPMAQQLLRGRQQCVRVRRLQQHGQQRRGLRIAGAVLGRNRENEQWEYFDDYCARLV